MGDSAETSGSGELSWNLPEEGEDKPPKKRRGDDVFSIGAVIDDRYKLYKHLGKGAVGTVWEAYDQKLGRPVAIKLIRTDCEVEMADRFVREAKAAAAMQTVHVVAVYDNGTFEGVPYIVMERLEGETVSDVMDRNGQLRMEQVASLLIQCAAALRCAHERGVIHRDLKPANLFVSKSEDGYETLKLLDFGVAKQPDDAAGEATESGVILGTPHYMSPEQARAHKDLDHRTDLWSLAVILYRALTGERPWTGGAAVDVILNICSEKAPPPKKYRPELPSEVDVFFERAFAQSVDDRFQSADELRDAFLHAAQIVPAAVRDQSSSALTTGRHVAWDSSDMPRPSLSDAGNGLDRPPSIPSMSGATKVTELGTLSASSSVRDFEHATKARTRSRLVIAAVATVLVGGAMAVVVVGGRGESQPAPATAATPAPSPERSHVLPAPEPTTAASPSVSASATARSVASAPTSPPPSRFPRGRVGKPTPKEAPPQPTASPDGKKRLPLY